MRHCTRKRGVGLATRAPFDKVVGQEASGPANVVSFNPNALLKGTLAGMVAVAGGIVNISYFLPFRARTCSRCAYSLTKSFKQVALSSIHRIGTRTHPLLSVNYFSWVMFLVTTIASFSLSGVIWPTDFESWCLLVLLGLVGFCMEYLLTAGLGSDRSPSVTIMIYSQFLWPILLDWLIWHSSVNWLTIVGCFGVIISLTTLSLVNEPQGSKETIDSDLVAESELEDVNNEQGGRRVA